MTFGLGSIGTMRCAALGISSKAMTDSIFSSTYRRNFTSISTKQFDNTKSPVHVFGLRELGVDQDYFLSRTKKLFHKLPWDTYDQKKEQLALLESHLPKEVGKNSGLLYDYYLGKANLNDLKSLRQLLPEKASAEFDAIAPFRRRSVSRFILEKRPSKGSEWTIERIPAESFSQGAAKIAQDGFDIRSLPRVFPEINNVHVISKEFVQTLLAVTQMVSEYHPEIMKFDITVHHVMVVSKIDKIRGNSPEGIHQDGFPYLVTALVIDREGVVGGESQVFQEDKTTMIFKTVLQPGQALMQPDLGTKLWHYVTPVRPTGTIGHRSTIGFDIDLIAK